MQPTRVWILVSVALITIGFGVFGYKVVVLRYPLGAGEAPGAWRVELAIDLSGQGDWTTVEASLPRSTRSQQLVSEEVRSGPLRFSITEEDFNRHGRWTGKLQGNTVVSYQATVNTKAVEQPIPAHETRPEYPDAVAALLAPSPGIAVQDPVFAALSEELLLERRDRVKLAHDIYRFVSREVDASLAREPMDATTVIREGRGNPLGRARLFCALARQNELPCRVVMGLAVADANPEDLRYWNEVHLGGGWVPFDVVERRAGAFPGDRVVLSTREDAPVRVTGARAVSHRFFVQTASAVDEEILRRSAKASSHALDRYSLLALPVRVQRNLRLLLLVPLGALVIALLRNVGGVRSFGMFMPMLIALAFTATGLVTGTVLFAIIIGAALLSRLLIQPFFLLLAARVAFILTLIVLLMVVIVIGGDRLGLSMSGVTTFPFVIMTMIVERISVSLEEEGAANTLRRVAGTLLAIYITYAVIHSPGLQTLFLVFPELIICILGLLVAVGRYTGYRLSELVRFRALAAAPPPAAGAGA
jgi:hypothetical protein